MRITKRHLKIFQNITSKYQSSTELDVKNNWKKKTNNELWLNLVGQVIVVGGVAGFERFDKSADLKKELAYDYLTRFGDDKSLQTQINKVLRAAGVRYSSANLKTCEKSKCLVYNFKCIVDYKGHLKGILKHLANIKGHNAEFERVDFLIHHLKFIKNKSARDFLMTMGMNQDTLALDIRLQNIFMHFGIDFPTTAQLAKKSIYEATEKEIIKKICVPLNIKPAKFDRILFQHYYQIVGRKDRRMNKINDCQPDNCTSDKK